MTEFNNSMPDLQSVSDSEDSVPDLESVSATKPSKPGSWDVVEDERSNGRTDEGCGGGCGIVMEDDKVMDNKEDPQENFILDLPRDISAEPVTSFAGAVIEATPKARSELYDSGASCHMIPFHDQLIKYTPIEPCPITGADKRTFHALGKGDMRVRIPNGNTTSIIMLRDVLYAPSMGLTIISISRVTAAGYAAMFCSRFCRIFDTKDHRIGHIPVSTNGLYRVDHKEVVSSATTTGITVDDLHRRMGHIAHDAAKKLVKGGLVTGVTLVGDNGEWRTCESCKYVLWTTKLHLKH